MVGREGDGPGESRYPSSVVLRGDGEIAVFDFQRRALVRFGADGAVLEQQSFGLPYNGCGMVAHGFYPDTADG